MNKHLLYILLLCAVCQLNLLSQDNRSVLNMNYHEVYQALNPLLLSENPGAITYNPTYEASIFSVGYNNTIGQLKPSLIGSTINNFNLHTESYRRIDNTTLFGEINYNRVYERDVNYSNNFYPYRQTPYQFYDMTNQTVNTKEQYDLEAIISHQFNQYFILAWDINYLAALQAQDRDPRALNKVMHIKNKLGLITNIDALKLGATFLYNHYNEDIDINVIENNTTHTIWSHTGLGTYSKHTAKSFFREYKQKSYGFSTFFKTKRNLLEYSFNTSNETAYDGRAEGDANWSNIKEDSKLKGKTVNLSNVFTVQNKLFTHQFRIGIDKVSFVGTEVLQNLENVSSEFDIQQWNTYFESDKYTNKQTEINLQYGISKFYSSTLRNYFLQASIAYHNDKETYHLNDYHIHYDNLNYKIEASKTLIRNKHKVETTINMTYIQNINEYAIFDNESIITELIIIPDYIYNTANILESNVELSYSFLNMTNYSYFITGKYGIQQGIGKNKSLSSRQKIGLTLGVMF